MKKLLSTLALSVCLLTLGGNTQAQVTSGQGITANADFFCSLSPTGAPGFNFLMCGASLIHPQWVLTAAHCVFDPFNNQPATSLDVIIAPYVPASGTNYQKIASQKIVAHASYNPNGSGYDIALIKLKTPVTANDPIALPPQGNTSLTGNGATCYVAGFGIYDTMNMSAQPDTLQFAQIQIIDNNTCNQFPVYAGSIEPDMICAGTLSGPSKGGAQGDSGGPLWVSSPNGPVQVGVVSFGAGQITTPTRPGVYTRIATYRQWIDSVIQADAVSVNTIPESRATLTRTEQTISFRPGAPAQHDLSYAIYNYEGRLVQSGTWAKGNVIFTADATALHNSLYFIHVTDNRNYRFTGKLPILR